MPDAIAKRAQKAIAENVFPGCVVGIVRASGEREVLPFGHFTYEADAPSVTADTVYDLASVTKSIPVASLAALFVAKGLIRLGDAVVTYIPELQNDYSATVEDLLRYRVHGLQLSALNYTTFEEIRTRIFEHGFDGPAGESRYTNLPAFLLGVVLERVGGNSLEVLAHKHFFEALRMTDTSFFHSDTSRIPPTEIVSGAEVRGIVHDESARVFARAQRAVGHAGLFSSAPDILNFLESLMQARYPAVTESAQKGLGWQNAEAWFAGVHTGTYAFGKTGFTGTSVLCDVEKGVGLVILSNRTYPVRPPDARALSSAVNVLRADIADIVLA